MFQRPVKSFLGRRTMLLNAAIFLTDFDLQGQVRLQAVHLRSPPRIWAYGLQPRQRQQSWGPGRPSIVSNRIPLEPNVRKYRFPIAFRRYWFAFENQKIPRVDDGLRSNRKTKVGRSSLSQH
jgi:hypothetical protein